MKKEYETGGKPEACATGSRGSMVSHLVQSELRRARAFYALLAAAMVCGGFFYPRVALRFGAEGESLWYWCMAMLGAAAGVVVVFGNRWYDDRAFWRTNPVTPRQLLAGQVLALIVALALPFAAGMGAGVWSLHLGAAASCWAVAVPTFALSLVAVFVAGYVAVIMEGRGVNQAVMFALYGVGIVALISMGVTHATWFPRSSFYGIPGEGLELTRTLLILVFLAACAGMFLWWGTVRRNRKAAVLVLLAGVLVYPLFRLATNAWNVFPDPVLEKRTVIFAGISESGRRVAPEWSGLREGEFFAPEHLEVDWIEGGTMRSVVWDPEMQILPDGGAMSLPLSEILMRRFQARPFEGFLDAADPSGIWKELRAESGVGEGWAFHAPEAPSSSPEMLAFCRSTGRDGVRVSAGGVVFRMEKTAPVTPVAPGRLEGGGPGILEIRSVKAGGAKLVVEVVRVAPSSALGGEDGRVFERISSPPQLWAVLVHRPSRTAYGAFGVPVRFERTPLRRLYFGGVRRDAFALTFLFPRFESGLLGLDPEHILSESELHVFRAVPVGRVVSPAP